VTIRFVEEARQELLDAILYYEEIRADLGARFKEEGDRCILWVADHPDLYRLRPTGYRRNNFTTAWVLTEVADALAQRSLPRNTSIVTLPA
jgi:hypothetical protein